MKLFTQALVGLVVIIGAGSVAKADLVCVDGLKIVTQGQEIEIKDRMSDGGYLVRDSIINGVLGESNVFLQARGSNIVVEVRVNPDQAPDKEGVDQHTEMEYLIELDAATNDVVKVEFSRHQQIDYGSPIPVVTQFGFQTIQRGSCE